MSTWVYGHVTMYCSFFDVNNLIYINSETSLLDSTGMFPATNRCKHLHYSVLGYFSVLLWSNGKFMLFDHIWLCYLQTVFMVFGLYFSCWWINPTLSILKSCCAFSGSAYARASPSSLYSRRHCAVCCFWDSYKVCQVCTCSTPGFVTPIWKGRSIYMNLFPSLLRPSVHWVVDSLEHPQNHYLPKVVMLWH